MDKRLTEHLRSTINAEISLLISKKCNLSEFDGLRIFLNSETYKMLCDDSLEMWKFSPIALFDMWENEIATGTPRNSLYLRS